jgi:RNA polymerase sigma-70 factor (ECF subfamily)
MDETRERRIAQGLRGGDPQAWRELYEAFAERVWRSVARLLGPASADVADVVQETFMAAARSARTYDEAKGSLGVWLTGIARRHLALHFRKEQRHDRQRLVSAALCAANGRLRQWLDGVDAPMPDALEIAELAQLVRATLAELPPEYEMALTAKYVDDVPVEQLAREERCTDVAIRSRLARARQAFRNEFSRRVPEHEAAG